MLASIKSFLVRVLSEKSLYYLVRIYESVFKFFLKCMLSKYMPNFAVKMFKNLGIEIIQFESMEQYALDYPSHVAFIYEKTSSLYYCSPNFDYLKSQLLLVKSNKSFMQYSAIVKQVKIIGGSNLLLTARGKAIYDLRYHDPDKNIQYTDGAILTDDYNYCIVKIKKSKDIFDEAIFMAGNFSLSYYHFLYEILCKFQQVDALDIDIKVPLLVDKINVDISQFKELLKMFNKNDREIIVIEKGKSYLVNRLYYVSCPHIIPPNYLDIKKIRAEDDLFDLDSLEYLRSKLIALAKPLEFPQKIFLSRRKASGRRPFNEPEVIGIFEQHGFKTVFPEDYSVAEQITLFNNADFIAGGSGGAFTNLLLCKRGCKVICLTNYAFDISVFSTICAYVGVDLLYICDTSKTKANIKNLHESFTIDLEKLDKTIAHWATLP